MAASDAPRSPAADAAWHAEAGARWRACLIGLAVLAFAIGAAAPLADIDFPLHLATGEWVARHHAVPLTEPFAWTRAGAPFFAYSWLVELLYYWVLAAAGPLGLHLLQGALLAATGASVYAVGRVSGWRPWTTVLLATLHVLLAVTLLPFVRPQLVLYALVPAAWVATRQVLDAARPLRWWVLLAVVAAIAANSHVLFPLTALPALLLVARPASAPHGAPWPRFGLVALALLVGWSASPYALVWGDVFRQNFAANVLIAPPSPIAEYKAGFTRADGWRGLTLPFALGLAALPWCVPASVRRGWRGAWLAAAWVVGLFGFGVVSKALFIWWLAAIPLTAAALDRLPTPSSVMLRRTRWATLYALAALLAVRMAGVTASVTHMEGTVARRTMPSPAAAAVEPLALWIESHGAAPRDATTPLDRRARLLTVFEYGDYLVWRLPGVSPSIDGRTIFPDSVAAPEAYRLAMDGPLPLGPWSAADLAIVPLRYPVAAVLDSARGWRRVAVVDAGPDVPLATGLWVNERWLRDGGAK
ncbi:MAG TPA: hypothetical protein VFJ74_04600 [Gemmatimonadaceae bacterium]|nr:hypothetical protein [Gemmatimonadaceae bacterium]